MLTKSYHRDIKFYFFVFQIIDISFKKRKHSLLLWNYNSMSPSFLINLGVLYHLPSPLYHFFVTVKSCFLLGSGETLAWTTVSSFLWKILKTNKQIASKQWQGSRTEQIRMLRVLEGIILYIQLKEAIVHTKDPEKRYNDVPLHRQKGQVFYFYWKNH